MIRLLDRVLLEELQLGLDARRKVRQRDGSSLKHPGAHGGWPLPLRWLLAMRLTNLKLLVLNHRMFKGRLPTDEVLAQAVLTHLEGRICPWAGKPWHRLLRSAVFYPLVLTTAITVVLLQLDSPHKQERYREAFGRQLPVYSAAMFDRRATATSRRGMGARHRDSSPGISPGASQSMRLMLEALPPDEELRGEVHRALAMAGDETLSPRTISRRFASTNRSLLARGMDLHLVPKVLSGPCYLMDGSPFRADDITGVTHPRLCRAVMILPYQVLQTVRYMHRGTTYPVHFLERLDRRPVTRGALGVTTAEVRNSQVFQRQIVRFALDRVVPAAAHLGQPRLLPLRSGRFIAQAEVIRPIRQSLKTLYTGAEYDELQRLADALTSGQGAARLRRLLLRPGPPETAPVTVGQTIREALKWLAPRTDGAAHISHMRSLADRLLVRLQDRLANAVAIHEVSHQIHNRGWTPPGWADRTIRRCLVSPPRTTARTGDPFAEVFADEVAAYLTQLALGRGLRGVTMAHLLMFTVDEHQQGTPESLAGYMILSALSGRSPGGCPSPEEAARLFRALGRATGWNDERLGIAARRAYRTLFGESVPLIQRAGMRY